MQLYKKKIPRKTNLLELTPVLKVEFELNENQNVVLLIPRFKSSFAQKYLIPKFRSKFIKANLDEIGSLTFLLIDGKKNIFEISNLLKEKHGDEVEPVYERVSKFIAYLFQYGLVDFKEI